MKLRNTFPPVPKHGLDWCIQNFGRIKALSLQSDLLDDFMRLSNANGSSIVALELSYITDGTSSGTLAKICNDSTPQLRTLRLYGIRLPWQRKKYSNLTSLTVVIPDGVLEDDKNITHIFKESPNLEEFSLSCTRGVSVLARNYESYKLLRMCPNPIPLPKLRIFSVQLSLLDVQYLLRQISTPESTQLNIQVKTPPVLEWQKGQPGTLPEDLQTILPEDQRCLQAFTAVKTLVIDASERVVQGWVIPQGEMNKPTPNVTFKILPGLCPAQETLKRKDVSKAIADELFSSSSAFLLKRLISPASLSRLILREANQQYMDAQQHSRSLKRDAIIPLLRPYILLTNLTFDHYPPDIVTSIYDEIEHSATPCRCFENIVFKNMNMESRSLRNLLTVMERFGKKPFRSLMSNCTIMANSQKDVMEVFEPLSVAGAIEPNSIISVNWNRSTHAIRCSFSEANGWTWAEMQD